MTTYKELQDEANKLIRSGCSEAYSQSSLYASFGGSVGIDVVSKSVRNAIINDFYPLDNHSVIFLDVEDKDFIVSLHNSKSPPCWGQGWLGSTEYFLLATFSPSSFGGKQSVFVVHESVLNKVGLM